MSPLRVLPPEPCHVIAFVNHDLGIALQSRVEFPRDAGLPEVIPEAYILFLSPNGEASKPLIVPLQMSDLDYAQALSEGQEPLQESVFARALIAEGIDPAEARQVAPLLGKHPRSPQEQEQILQLWRKWCLVQGHDQAAVDEAGLWIGRKGYPTYLYLVEETDAEGR